MGYVLVVLGVVKDFFFKIIDVFGEIKFGVRYFLDFFNGQGWGYGLKIFVEFYLMVVVLWGLGVNGYIIEDLIVFKVVFYLEFINEIFFKMVVFKFIVYYYIGYVNVFVFIEIVYVMFLGELKFIERVMFMYVFMLYIENMILEFLCFFGDIGEFWFL